MLFTYKKLLWGRLIHTCKNLLYLLLVPFPTIWGRVQQPWPISSGMMSWRAQFTQRLTTLPKLMLPPIKILFGSTRLWQQNCRTHTDPRRGIKVHPTSRKQVSFSSLDQRFVVHGYVDCHVEYVPCFIQTHFIRGSSLRLRMQRHQRRVQQSQNLLSVNKSTWATAVGLGKWHIFLYL